MGGAFILIRSLFKNIPTSRIIEVLPKYLMSIAGVVYLLIAGQTVLNMHHLHIRISEHLDISNQGKTFIQPCYTSHILSHILNTWAPSLNLTSNILLTLLTFAMTHID